MDKTLFQEIQDTYPNMNNTQIRNTLASFLFTGDDVFKLIRDLSGGERGRVSLAKLMLSDANFLLLDEPTNHLDITSKEILESALNRYTGTVLYVSHDRYFINRTATRILDLTGQSFVNYIGNYDYYLEKKEDVEGAFFAGRGSEALKRLRALRLMPERELLPVPLPPLLLQIQGPSLTGRLRRKSRPGSANVRMNLKRPKTPSTSRNKRQRESMSCWRWKKSIPMCQADGAEQGKGFDQ